jgi:hypothetical protein
MGTRSLLPIENKAVLSLPYGGVVSGKKNEGRVNKMEKWSIDALSSGLVALVLFLLLARWFLRTERWV